MVVLDREGRIVRLNRACEQMHRALHRGISRAVHLGFVCCAKEKEQFQAIFQRDSAATRVAYRV